jgi:Leucine-rich repeat (LRR) protein
MLITSSKFLRKEILSFIIIIIIIIIIMLNMIFFYVCPSFQSLVLSNNKIKRWPHTVVSSLPCLSSLKLDNNPLVEVI